MTVHVSCAFVMTYSGDIIFPPDFIVFKKNASRLICLYFEISILASSRNCSELLKSVTVTLNIYAKREMQYVNIVSI